MEVGTNAISRNYLENLRDHNMMQPACQQNILLLYIYIGLMIIDVCVVLLETRASQHRFYSV